MYITSSFCESHNDYYWERRHSYKIGLLKELIWQQYFKLLFKLISYTFLSYTGAFPLEVICGVLMSGSANEVVKFTEFTDSQNQKGWNFSQLRLCSMWFNASCLCQADSGLGFFK